MYKNKGKRQTKETLACQMCATSTLMPGTVANEKAMVQFSPKIKGNFRSWAQRGCDHAVVNHYPTRAWEVGP